MHTVKISLIHLASTMDTWCFFFNPSNSIVRIKLHNQLIWKGIVVINTQNYAFWIAKTSTSLESILLVEQEKIQGKFPSWFLKTPPIHKGSKLSFADALIFHFCISIVEGIQDESIFIFVLLVHIKWPCDEHSKSNLV